MCCRYRVISFKFMQCFIESNPMHYCGNFTESKFDAKIVSKVKSLIQ